MNSPHTRILLPDGRHSFDQSLTMYGCHWAIIDRDLTIISLRGLTLSGYFPYTNPRWQDLATAAYELAVKRFPAKKDQQVQDYQRSYRK